jgi:hypothetical protein
MKNRILTFFFVITATIVTGQIDSGADDKTKLLGSWGIQEMKKDGELVMSVDPKEQQIIIDNAWMKDSVLFLEVGKDLIVANFKEQSETLARVIFTFGENDMLKVSPNDGESEDVFSSYTINEEKKELSIEEENGDKLIYTYIFFDDQLILKQGEGDELIFKRMKL